MNEVYISGFVSGNPVLRMERENAPHLFFYVDIQHKTRSGRNHHEMYAVNAWHNVALRGHEKLKNGQHVMLRGYLTQRPVRAGDLSYMLTELTVKDFASSDRSQTSEAKQENPQACAAAEAPESMEAAAEIEKEGESAWRKASQKSLSWQ